MIKSFSSGPELARWVALVCAGGIALVLALAMSRSALGAILIPLFVICAISVLFWHYLMVLERGLPIFELGAVFMLATMAYAALPLLWYAFSGMQLTILSHRRLYDLDPTPEQFSEAGWMHVVFMGAFALAYAAWRTRNPVSSIKLANTSRPEVMTVIGLWLLLNGIFLFLRIALGINFTVAYDDSLSVAHEAFLSLPLIARQFVQHGYGILFILNIAVVLLAISRWGSRGWRTFLYLWMAFSVSYYILNPGGRFALASIFIAFLLAFHRFVRPLRMGEVLIGGVLLFLGFVAAGLIRGGERSVFEGVQAVFDLLDGYHVLFSIADEFQNAYGSILEFKSFLERGLLDPIPWQIYAPDILMPIPQQILPFDKVEPVDWYVSVTRNSDYFTYSVFSQSFLGFGWWEIAARGALFGLVMAAVHNWYARKPSPLWRNVFYVWLAIISYQSVRNTSLYLLALILYRFVPLLLVVHFGVWLLRTNFNGQNLSRPTLRLEQVSRD